MSSNLVTIILPSNRSDTPPTPLALSEIASYTINKSVGSGAASVLQTVNGPFTDVNQSFSDPSPDFGETDNYSVTVTDVEGNVSAAGVGSVIDPASQLAPPAAPTVTAVFVP